MMSDDGTRNTNDVIASIQKTCNHFSIGYDKKCDYSKLAKVVEGNSHLKKLSLKCMGETLCIEKYTGHLASALANVKFAHLCLDLYCFNHEKEFIPYVVDCFIGAARRSPTIQHLELNRVKEENNTEIANCLPHLQSLRLQNMFYLKGNNKFLREDFLRKTSTLTTLHLINAFIGSTNNYWKMSKALASNTSITTLHLDHCDMDDDCVKAFLKHWKHESQIHTLAFENTTLIKAKAAILLVKAASSHPALESLSIKGNYRIGCEGLANIALELPNLELKSLNMASCCVFNCGRDDAQNWRETVVMVGGLIVQGVSVNTHLDEIDVSDNRLGGAQRGVDEAVAFYMLRKKCTPLMVSEMHLPASVWCHCFAKNGQNASFIFHFLREQPMLWRVCCKNSKRQRTH